MNRNMNLPQIQHIMMEFEKESEIMDMKEEMMSDTIDEAMEEEDDEEEQDAIVNQVLDEIGIHLDESVRKTTTCVCMQFFRIKSQKVDHTVFIFLVIVGICTRNVHKDTWRSWKGAHRSGRGYVCR